MSEIASWPEGLEAAIAGSGGFFRRTFVVPETGSTQDAARRVGATAGDIVTTGRQITGRGRRGRRWEDTGADGVAVTFVLEPAAPARLAIAGAVGVALALEPILGARTGQNRIGLKWPNDVLAGDRKLAGLLAEQAGGLAYLGVGVNVGQKTWPDSIADRAVSLRQLGATTSRLEVIVALVDSLSTTLRAPAESVNEAFAARDVLVGTVRTVQSSAGTFTGRILEVDPMRGLAVEGPKGRIWLEAATTTVLPEGN